MIAHARIPEPALVPFLDLIRETAGLVFSDCSWNDIRRAVAEFSRLHGDTPESYHARLQRDAAALAEFLDAVTITETYFFRESRQFSLLETLLREEILPAGRPRLECWSATAASGEEAFSLALLLEHCGVASYAVHASDINTRALETLAAGRYRRRSLREDGLVWHPLLERHATRDGDTIEFHADLRRTIVPRRINIHADGDWPIPDNLDFVFFRNTLIYMPEENRRRALERIGRHIRPGGFLFVGVSEVPTIRPPEFTLFEGASGSYCFRKDARREKETDRP